MRGNKWDMLTLQQLKDMPSEHIFASWVTTDDPDGINIWNTGSEIQWVAVRWDGYHDWAVYMRGHWNGLSLIPDIHSIARSGDKCPKSYVRNILQCDDEALELYRE